MEAADSSARHAIIIAASSFISATLVTAAVASTSCALNPTIFENKNQRTPSRYPA